MSDKGEIRVRIPARPDYVHVVRSVTAGVAARLDLPLDDIEDLRIAVDEACSQLLTATGNATHLTLSMRPVGQGLELVAYTDGDVEEWPPPEVEGSLIWGILSALTDDPKFERWEGNPAMRLVKRLTPTEAR